MTGGVPGLGMTAIQQFDWVVAEHEFSVTISVTVYSLFCSPLHHQPSRSDTLSLAIQGKVGRAHAEQIKTHAQCRRERVRRWYRTRTYMNWVSTLLLKLPPVFHGRATKLLLLVGDLALARLPEDVCLFCSVENTMR